LEFHRETSEYHWENRRNTLGKNYWKTTVTPWDSHRKIIITPQGNTHTQTQEYTIPFRRKVNIMGAKQTF